MADQFYNNGTSQGALNQMDYYGAFMYNNGNSTPFGPRADPDSFQYLPMYTGDPLDPYNYNGQFEAQIKKMAQLQFGLSDEWVATPLGQQDLATAEQLIRNQMRSSVDRRRLPGGAEITAYSAKGSPTSPSFSSTPAAPPSPSPQVSSTFGGDWRKYLHNLTGSTSPDQKVASTQPVIGEPYSVTVNQDGSVTPGYLPSRNASTNVFVDWLSKNPNGLQIFHGGDPYNQQNYSRGFTDTEKTQIRDFLDQYASDTGKLQSLANLMSREPPRAGETFAQFLDRIQQEDQALQALY